MLKYVVTLLATSLAFSNREYNPHLVFKAAVNGTFYCSRSGRLAGLVWWDGKEISPLPVKVRGGVVCWTDGKVSVGYFEVSGSGGVLFNGKKIGPADVLWAITGGGLFLNGNEVYSAKEVAQREGLSTYITRHSSYSFILVHNDRKTITLGVSKGGVPPSVLAQRCRGRYHGLLRLDGGSATHYFFNRKRPSWVNNAVGLPR